MPSCNSYMIVGALAPTHAADDGHVFDSGPYNCTFLLSPGDMSPVVNLWTSRPEPQKHVDLASRMTFELRGYKIEVMSC